VTVVSDEAASGGSGAGSKADDWYQKTVEEVITRVGSSHTGLTALAASTRLREIGSNEIPRTRGASLGRLFLRQVSNPLVVVLLLAGALSVSVGHALDAIFIGAVVLLNALVAMVQEWRAERGAESLRRMIRFQVIVERDGQIRTVDASQIVPGDLIRLESGSRVPADGRLLDDTGLETDESLLTGESVPVAKDASWLPESGPGAFGGTTAIAERRNMVHAGTTVVRGRGRAIVIETGVRSTVGRLARDVAEARAGRPPLLLRLDRLARQIGAVSIAAAILVAGLGVLVHGHDLVEMLIFGAALAVSVIPEGLPLAVTIALSVASSRMARRGVIVRRLGAVEGLGSCTLIASDKTGTLTQNELSVREVRLSDGQVIDWHRATNRAEDRSDALDRLALIAVLCNEGELPEQSAARSASGDPTDTALLQMARQIGREKAATLAQLPPLGMIPFEPERRFAASFHRADGSVRIMVKGAPEQVIGMCGSVDGARWLDQAHAMGDGGMRVLALAEGSGVQVMSEEIGGLRLAGLVGMIDPLREGASDAVQRCARAGIDVCMVTGDHPRTALAIARDLGIADQLHQVVTGEALDQMEEAQTILSLAGRPHHRVFARVTPAQKLRIVEAARAAGHFVAVTGDGANDAPALKAANIGVAMGRSGTDVARDASDLVVSDDNFATIVAGVEEGRIAYDNIRKVIYLLLSTNGAEIVTMVAALAAGLPLPLLPTQLLWLNLATEGAQVAALALEPGEKGVLQHPPRSPREPIFNRLMIERLIAGSVIGGTVCVTAFGWMVHRGWDTQEARNALLLLMVLLQNVELGNARSETRSGFVISPARNPALVLSALSALGLQTLAMHWAPLQVVLGTSPASAETWGVCALLSLSVFAGIELHKLTWWWRHRV